MQRARAGVAFWTGACAHRALPGRRLARLSDRGLVAGRQAHVQRGALDDAVRGRERAERRLGVPRGPSRSIAVGALRDAGRGSAPGNSSHIRRRPLGPGQRPRLVLPGVPHPGLRDRPGRARVGRRQHRRRLEIRRQPARPEHGRPAGSPGIPDSTHVTEPATTSTGSRPRYSASLTSTSWPGISLGCSWVGPAIPLSSHPRAPRRRYGDSHA